MVGNASLGRKLLRDLRAGKFQFGAVALVITLGIATFVGPFAAYLNLENALEDYFQRFDMAHFWLSVDYLTERAVRQMNTIPGVTAQGRVLADVVVEMGDRGPERVTGRVAGLPPREQPKVNRIKIIEGTYFSDSWTREVLVEERFARFHGLKPGDWLTIRTGDTAARYQIAGIATSPEFMYPIKSAQELITTPRTFGVFFMPQPLLSALFDMEGMVNDVTIMLNAEADGPTVINSLKHVLKAHGIARITERNEPRTVASRKADVLEGVRAAYLTHRNDQITYKLVKQDLDSFRQMAFQFPMLFLVIASLTIYILMGRLVQAQRVQIGLMRGLGYSKDSILGHYLAFALTVGTVGALFGAGLGVVLGYFFSGYYAGELNLPLTTYSLYWPVMVTGIGVGIAVPVLAGILPAWGAARLHPALAMRPAPPIIGRRSPLEMVLPFLSKLPYVLRLPLRNVSRKVRHSLSMAFGVAAAVSFILVSMSFVDVLEKALDTQFNVTQRYDAVVHFQGRGAAATAGHFARLDGIRKAEPVLEVAYRIRHGDESADTSIMGLPLGASLYNPVTADGRPLAIPQDAILLPSTIKNRFGPHPDVLRLEPLVGTVGDTEVRFAGYAETLLSSRAFMRLEDLQRMIGAPGSATSVLIAFDGAPTPDLLK
ncbi:MAG: ABC transporter permease, partial [Dehalococcoidia bacterium]|nr:ABC transporter permease [Dehalococcoidia bacterium]